MHRASVFEIRVLRRITAFPAAVFHSFCFLMYYLFLFVFFFFFAFCTFCINVTHSVFCSTYVSLFRIVHCLCNTATEHRPNCCW
jgi:hypothetical protein